MKRNYRFAVFYTCHKNRNELIRFIDQILQSRCRNDLRFRQEFEPVKSLLELLKSTFELADEFRRRSCATSFAVVRSDRRAAPEDLLAKYLTLGRVGQSGVKANDS